MHPILALLGLSTSKTSYLNVNKVFKSGKSTVLIENSRIVNLFW
jgi:hypothetical protein